MQLTTKKISEVTRKVINAVVYLYQIQKPEDYCYTNIKTLNFLCNESISAAKYKEIFLEIWKLKLQCSYMTEDNEIKSDSMPLIGGIKMDFNTDELVFWFRPFIGNGILLSQQIVSIYPENTETNNQIPAIYEEIYNSANCYLILGEKQCNIASKDLNKMTDDFCKTCPKFMSKKNIK